MNITDRVTTNTIKTTATTLGKPLPKAVTAAYDQAEKLASESLNLGSTDGLEQAVTAALLADREPATDPDVQSIVTAQTLTANVMLPQTIAAAALERIAVACRENTSKILAGWTAAFDQAVNDMTKAHARIGDLSLDDTTSIMAKGNDIADVWASASTAVQTLDAVIAGWTSLVQLTRAAQIKPDHRPLRIAALTYDQWQELPAKLTVWDALRAGLTLSLPTLEEYRKRVAQIQAAQAAPETQVDTYRSAVAGREIRVSA